MPRKQYEMESNVIVTLDDEKLKDVRELLEARFNEMLGRMEHNDDIRIDLVTYFEVKERE